MTALYHETIPYMMVYLLSAEFRGRGMEDWADTTAPQPARPAAPTPQPERIVGGEGTGHKTTTAAANNLPQQQQAMPSSAAQRRMTGGGGNGLKLTELVDKGDGKYEEVQHADGKVEAMQYNALKT